MIVNQTFVGRVFPNDDAIGRNVYLSEPAGRKAYRVVGVVRDVRNDVRRPDLTWYFPALQHADHPFSTSFLIRAKAGRTPGLSELMAAVKAENAALRIDSFDSADSLLNGTLDTDRLMARLSEALGLLSVLLAAVGIYGLVSYDVTKRRGEIGIRAALGAFRTDIIWLVLSEVVIITTLGACLGGVAAITMAGLVRGLVFGLNVDDPRFELTAAAVLVAVALLAAAIPVRRAATLDPMQALRSV
jgi:cell division protein FtsX